ncbi:hypothetical protein BHE74_00007876 [Ensete ventricosum]|nr:hypothetical protein GW17_00024203 [Ensete ventricosum]RWW83612.1 hypothetical protein BHE74_00007876 [Ensete ventricosum]
MSSCRVGFLVPTRATKRVLPAALLAEPLVKSMGDDDGGLEVELAHLVAAVVVLCTGEVGPAPLSLAARRSVGCLEAVPGRKVGPMAPEILSDLSSADWFHRVLRHGGWWPTEGEVVHGEERRWAIQNGSFGEEGVVGVVVVGAGLVVPKMALLAAAFQPSKGRRGMDVGLAGAGSVHPLLINRLLERERKDKEEITQK